TGEPNSSADSFFGAGLYRIDNADTAPTLVGPINTGANAGPDTATTDCFTGRSISRIVVKPTDPASILVSTGFGIGGIGASSYFNVIPPLAPKGIWRSTNATAAAGSVQFNKLTVTTQGNVTGVTTGNRAIDDMAID